MCVEIEQDSTRRLQAICSERKWSVFEICNFDEILVCNSFVNSKVPNLGTYDNAMLLDSAAEYHMVNDKHKLVNIEEVEVPFHIRGIDSKMTLLSCEYGSMFMKLENTKGNEYEVHLSCVLYVPDLSVDLFAIPRLFEENKYGYDVQRDYAHIYYNAVSKEIVATGIPVDKLKWIRYRFLNQEIEAFPSAVLRNVTPNEEDIFWLCHQKLGHMSAKNMKCLEQTADGVGTFI